jgi:parallel beta-helix repeat protein
VEHRRKDQSLTGLAAVVLVAGIVIAAGLLALGAGPAAAATLTFTPQADSYVDAANPTTNYGNNSTLRVDGSPVVRSYLRFDVQGVSGGVSSAKLRIFANSNHSVGFSARPVSDNSWTETGINDSNAPVPGAVAASTGQLVAGTWYELDVTSLVSGNGLRSFALTTTHTTALSLASKESSNDPQLVVNTGGSTPPPTSSPTSSPTAAPTPTPPPTSGRLTVISRSGSTYLADARWAGGQDYSGTRLKTVGESAIADMDNAGGGTIQFEAGIFDLGPDWFHIRNISNIVFAGRGMDVTFLQNNTSIAADTEPFNTGHMTFVTIRDMTVSAGGAARGSSDALDMDGANNSVVERVKVTASRGRAIVFDGKGDFGVGSSNNVVRDCVVTGAQYDGIELLAADNNRIENCHVSGVLGHGIQVTKSSATAHFWQNDKANDNVVIGNTVTNAGIDGINLNSSDRNQLLNNTLTGNTQNGIRLNSANSITCNDNRISGNNMANNLKWGLNISSTLCNRTVVGPNTFSGNVSGAIRDNGTGTVY